jgi:Glycosyl hydrolases family 28
VAIKSGWDQYGIRVARPSSNITVQWITGTTPTCSGIGIGSEMSGGVSDILIRDIHIYNSSSALRLKSDRGRGGYITNITVTNVTMQHVKIPIRFSRGANDHPDANFDEKCLPRISNVYISNVVGEGISRAPVLEGIEGTVYEEICIRNISLRGVAMKEKWKCEFVKGEVYDASPWPCEELLSMNSSFSSWCNSKH